MRGYQSPEEAAMVGFPEKYCRVVWWRQPSDIDPRVMAIRLRGEWVDAG